MTRVYTWAQLKSLFPLYVSDGLITIVRHGQTTFNAARLVSGSRPDIQLTPAGKSQARLLAQLEGPYDLAISSSLPRAIATLDIAIEAGLDVASVSVDSRLNERCLGVLEGHPFQDVPEYRLGDLTYAPKGGESYLSVTQRILSFLVDMDWSQRTLIVTHVGPMRIMLSILDGTASPVAVLDRQCKNSEAIDIPIGIVGWPKFLSSVEV